MTATTIRVQMAQRKDTAANWTAANPILLSGEIGYETDTKKFKIGDGTTNWNSLAYLPIPDGSGNLTITGNLEIGNTGSLTFEGSTADGFETTLAVTNPTADRTITLPDQSGTVLVSGNASIVDADISATAEIAVSKLADGTARQLLQTDAAGTGVEWASNIDIPGTLDVTGAATFDAAVTVTGDLTVAGNLQTGVSATTGQQQIRFNTQNTYAGQIYTDNLENLWLLGGAIYDGTNFVANTGTTAAMMRIVQGAIRFETNSSLTPSGNFTPQERLRITSAGLVGIGTGSPSARLDVRAGANNTAIEEIVAFARPDAAVRATINKGLSTGNGISFGTTTGQPLAFRTNDTERLYITSAGNVGIGAASPATALDVNGDVTIADKIIHGGDTNTAIRFPAADTVTVETNGTERMRIKSSGIINFSNAPVYADNTAALAGGLVAGDVYRKSDGTLMITY